MNTDLRFPIGKFDKNFDLSLEARRERIAAIAGLPARVADAVSGLDEAQIDTPYRPDGWTLRQTVHHLADSHANAITRVKLALTEDDPPTIRPYAEDRWAELSDNALPVDVSLRMIEGIHKRWTVLLNSMTDDDYRRTFIHPETGEWTLEEALALYAWHSLHHTAHITSLRERMGW